jgi:hypothetical protein
MILDDISLCCFVSVCVCVGGGCVRVSARACTGWHTPEDSFTFNTIRALILALVSHFKCFHSQT